MVVYLVCGWSRRWMSDDGFIYLRVVRQTLAGNGPVFNAGERVEAATGPLWVSVLAIGDVLTPVRLEWLAVILGIALSAGGLALAIAGARRLLGISGTQLAIPAGAAVLVAVPPMWTFASSGLENGLSFAWLGASLWLLSCWARDGARIPAWSAVVLGLGPLIRPDLAVFTVTFLVVLLVAGCDSWGDRLRLLAWALALPLVYQLFRMGYYGSLVPNPAAAKEASSSRWEVGWNYLRGSSSPYWLWFPVAVLAAGAYLPTVTALRRDHKSRQLLVLAAFVAAAVVHVVYVVRVGGDFMHARLILPGLFAFAAPVAVIPWRREYAVSVLLVPWVVAGLFLLRSSYDTYDAFGTHERNPVTIDDFGGWANDGGLRELYGQGGVFFGYQRLDADPVAGHRTVVASYGIGVVGYALGTDPYVLDLLGLADPFTAHLELEERGYPAHEKPLPAPWTAARTTRPGSTVAAKDFPFPELFSKGVRQLEDPDGQTFDERVRVARQSLDCGQLRDFIDSYTADLTAGRFVTNVFDSLHNARLRIPPEPRDAHARYC